MNHTPTISAIALLAALAATTAWSETPTLDAALQSKGLHNLPKPQERKPWDGLPAPKLAPDMTPEQMRRYVRAPVEYDGRFYKGNLTIIRVATEKEVSKRCPATTYPFKLGCAHHWGEQAADGSWGTCQVIIVADDVIAKANLLEETVYQHELAHCMGWDGWHMGAREAPPREPLSWLNLPVSVRCGLGIAIECK